MLVGGKGDRRARVARASMRRDILMGAHGGCREAAAPTGRGVAADHVLFALAEEPGVAMLPGCGGCGMLQGSGATTSCWLPVCTSRVTCHVWRYSSRRSRAAPGPGARAGTRSARVHLRRSGGLTSGHGLSSAGDLADEIMLHACMLHASWAAAGSPSRSWPSGWLRPSATFARRSTGTFTCPCSRSGNS